MKRDDFIRYYIEQYGYDPDEEIIARYCEPDFDRHDNFSRQTSFQPVNRINGSSALLEEVRGVMAGIARNANAAVKANGVGGGGKYGLGEFDYMFLIFCCKAGLYFLFRNSSREGYDFSNI